SSGKTLAYSTTGSSTHGIVLAFMKQYGLSAKPTATGGPPATLAQVMSGQIDIGWAAPPLGPDQLRKGPNPVIASGNDATVFKGQTVRLIVTNVDTLQRRKPAIERYMTAYRETVDAMYASDGTALKTYASWLGIPEETARRTRDQFFPKESISPDRIVG